MHSTLIKSRKCLILFTSFAHCICKCICEITGIPRTLAVSFVKPLGIFGWMYEIVRILAGQKVLWRVKSGWTVTRCNSNCWFLTQCLWGKREQWGWKSWRVTLKPDQGLRKNSIFNTLHNFQHTPCFTDVMVKLWMSRLKNNDSYLWHEIALKYSLSFHLL